jgi:hydroxypyruvate isomerase
MKVTRRKLAAAVLSSAAVHALAQTQPAASSPEEDLKAARERLRANADALGRQDVPMSTEPAFQFQA